MSVQPSNKSRDTLKKSDSDVFAASEKNGGKQRPSPEMPESNQKRANEGIEGEPNQANYGFGQRAELDTEGEVTEDQEYQANGLARTNKYSVDKTSKGINVQSERKGRADYEL